MVIRRMVVHSSSFSRAAAELAGMGLTAVSMNLETIIKIKEPKMPYIDYIAEEMVPPDDRVPDQDNILRIHGVHSRTMRQHYDLYKQLMYSKGPLSRIQREMIAVVVSAENKCRY